ncbi:hypothetical protein CANCADRAFT_851 [Tortispora caseinolytica NRRL Y-17796]|uniref:Protein ROT1 n=1 Tax=Tortispora caseinolytica NRRL Y-17796 TaxID=767744 RepID=A0A1E4TKI6_9ASCO|nr:hypothetical protein CANCADRAFT_851 [Tortispora caseinolytica NRRL Y-17796]
MAADTLLPNNNVTSLYGTWSTLSDSVFTGPGFYDPVDEYLAEPDHPGMSFSFTDDGYWEMAIYAVTPNPQTPSCPSAALIFQHGTYEIASNYSLVLSPFQPDGRQLYSNPCTDAGFSVYMRYYQFLVYQRFEILVDNYLGNYMLRLYEFDGTPTNPMYLKYRPPMMLPTITLNPTASADATTFSNSKLRKRSLESGNTSLHINGLNYDFVWWTFFSMMVCGGLAYFFI